MNKMFSPGSILRIAITPTFARHRDFADDLIFVISAESRGRDISGRREIFLQYYVFGDEKDVAFNKILLRSTFDKNRWAFSDDFFEFRVLEVVAKSTL
jgi:hypothetical protein